MKMIEAFGMKFPLETFIDSSGFIHRPSVPECRERFSGKVEIITSDLQIREEWEASQVDWHSVLAVKYAGSSVCISCGIGFEPEEDPIYATALVRDDEGRILPERCYRYIENSYEAEHCEECQALGDWEY